MKGKTESILKIHKRMKKKKEKNENNQLQNKISGYIEKNKIEWNVKIK